MAPRPLNAPFSTFPSSIQSEHLLQQTCFKVLRSWAVNLSHLVELGSYQFSVSFPFVPSRPSILLYSPTTAARLPTLLLSPAKSKKNASASCAVANQTIIQTTTQRAQAGLKPNYPPCVTKDPFPLLPSGPAQQPLPVLGREVRALTNYVEDSNPLTIQSDSQLSIAGSFQDA